MIERHISVIPTAGGVVCDLESADSVAVETDNIEGLYMQTIVFGSVCEAERYINWILLGFPTIEGVQ